MSNVKWMILALMILIGSISFVFYWYSGSIDEHREKQEQLTPLHQMRVSVSETPIYYEVMGAVTPKYETVISSEVNGMIERIFVREGDQVDENADLILVDAESSTRQLNQAINAKKKLSATLDLTKKQYERTGRLYKKDSASLTELEVAQTKYEETLYEYTRLEEKIHELENALNNYTITAPYRGIISKKYVETGDFAFIGKPLLEIYSQSPMLFELNLPESLLPYVQIGDLIDVYLTKNKETTEIKVIEITPYETPKSHTFTVRGTLEAPTSLFPGVFGRAKIPYGTKSRILVPKSAIREVGQLHTILVKEGRVWKRRYIRIGKEYEERVEVISGLKEGEIIGYEE